jgi:hypothetical protein
VKDDADAPGTVRRIPLSEQYRIVSKKWAAAENAAHLLEESKTTVLAQRKARLGDVPDAKAERIVKAAPEWERYIKDMCEARRKANLLKQQLKYIEICHREWISADANARKEAQERKWWAYDEQGHDGQG